MTKRGDRAQAVSPPFVRVELGRAGGVVPLEVFAPSAHHQATNRPAVGADLLRRNPARTPLNASRRIWIRRSRVEVDPDRRRRRHAAQNCPPRQSGRLPLGRRLREKPCGVRRPPSDEGCGYATRKPRSHADIAAEVKVVAQLRPCDLIGPASRRRNKGESSNEEGVAQSGSGSPHDAPKASLIVFGFKAEFRIRGALRFDVAIRPHAWADMPRPRREGGPPSQWSGPRLSRLTATDGVGVVHESVLREALRRGDGLIPRGHPAQADRHARADNGRAKYRTARERNPRPSS